jgi:hypothetical protein
MFLYLRASCIAISRVDKRLEQQGFWALSQGGRPEAPAEPVKLKRRCKKPTGRRTLDRRAWIDPLGVKEEGLKPTPKKKI